MNQFIKEEMNQIYHEMSKIIQLNHPSILKIIGFSPFDFKKEPKPVIVTEFTSLKTLQDILEMNSFLLHLKIHLEYFEYPKLTFLYLIENQFL